MLGLVDRIEKGWGLPRFGLEEEGGVECCDELWCKKLILLGFLYIVRSARGFKAKEDSQNFLISCHEKVVSILMQCVDLWLHGSWHWL